MANEEKRGGWDGRNVGIDGVGVVKMVRISKWLKRE